MVSRSSFAVPSARGLPSITAETQVQEPRRIFMVIGSAPDADVKGNVAKNARTTTPKMNCRFTVAAHEMRFVLAATRYGRWKIRSQSLGHSAPLELTDNTLNDPGDLLRIKRFTGGTAADGLIDEAFGGQQALNLIAEFDKALLLGRRLWLPSDTGFKATERDAGAKTLGKLGRIEHRVEEWQ